MSAVDTIKVIVILAIVLGAGYYVANMVKTSNGEMECFLGLGPSDAPTLCYGWSQKEKPAEMMVDDGTVNP